MVSIRKFRLVTRPRYRITITVKGKLIDLSKTIMKFHGEGCNAENPGCKIKSKNPLNRFECFTNYQLKLRRPDGVNQSDGKFIFIKMFYFF